MESQALFNQFKQLNLPLGEYIIVSGGVLAVRGIRETRDIDILASDMLWNQLKSIYEVKNDNDVEKIIPVKNIEILWTGSFVNLDKGKEIGPTTAEQISHAEIINGLAFQSLRDCLWFKSNSGREKDQKDLELIKEYLAHHPEEQI